MLTPRQNDIINAALELISTKGIQGMTIKNISQEIGVSEPAIYRHFENKIQILITILEIFETKTKEIFHSDLGDCASFSDKIEYLFESLFDIFSKSPSLVPVIFAEEIFWNEPVLSHKICEIINRNDKALSEIITNGQKCGQIRSDVDTKDIVLIIMGTIRLFVKKWHQSDTNFNIQVEGRKLFKSLRMMISTNVKNK
jgi:AcrR family transcriptional regulator